MSSTGGAVDAGAFAKLKHEFEALKDVVLRLQRRIEVLEEGRAVEEQVQYTAPPVSKAKPPPRRKSPLKANVKKKKQATEKLKWNKLTAEQLSSRLAREEEPRRFASVLLTCCQQLTVFPKMLCHYINLTELSITNCALAGEIPSLAPIKALAGLCLDNNQISALPDDLGHCQYLEYLSVSHNQLIALPQSMTLLEGLYRLNVQSNKITCLPEGIFTKCYSLRDVHLSHNLLAELPTSVEIYEARNLSVNGNPLRSIPPDYSKLTELRKITIAETLLPGIYGKDRRSKDETQSLLRVMGRDQLPLSSVPAVLIRLHLKSAAQRFDLCAFFYPSGELLYREKRNCIGAVHSGDDTWHQEIEINFNMLSQDISAIGIAVICSSNDLTLDVVDKDFPDTTCLYFATGSRLQRNVPFSPAKAC